MRAAGPGLLAVACGASLLFACLAVDRPVLATKDLDPPEFLEADPAAGSTIGREDPIFLTFSERMDPRSLRPGIWLLEEGRTPVPVVVELPEEAIEVPDAVEQTDVPYTIRVRPEQPLEPSTDYTLVLGGPSVGGDSVLTDTEGNLLGGFDGGTGAFGLSYTSSP